MNELLMDKEMSAESKYLFIVLSYLMEEQDQSYRATIEKLADRIGTSKTMVSMSLRFLSKKELISWTLDGNGYLELDFRRSFDSLPDESLNKVIKEIISDGKLRKRQIVKGNDGNQVVNQDSLSIQEFLLVFYLFNNMNDNFWVCGLSLKIMSTVISKSTQTAKRIFKSLNDKMSKFLDGERLIVYYSPGVKNNYGTFCSLCRLNPVLLGLNYFKEEVMSNLNSLQGNGTLPIWLSKKLTRREKYVWDDIYYCMSPQKHAFYLKIIEVVLSRVFELSYIKDGKVIKPDYHQIIRDEVLNDLFFSMFSRKNITMSRLWSYRVIIRSAEAKFKPLLSYLSKTSSVRNVLDTNYVVISLSSQSTTMYFFK
ncbi:TPA: hypothetical protein ACPVYN_002325 [Vibrio parahaemolyticus]|uniref:hypothetical protein n=1 Tax=Vibrio parahaemolyticus TaxID=670 RepID=UPI0003F7E4A1|nr:hypothetical protein [Vibrio parahaemolyticus]HCH1012651.1 hypothetical protein [Vibrio parahaemolyticus]